jgi:D-lactate dehydrogenase (cytochrome)
VPLSELPAAVEFARERADARGQDSSIVGHVGDGNFHVALMLDREDPAEIADAKALTDELVEYALAHGGTCTGEHGIGLGKLGFLEREHGAQIELMRSLKAAFDPNGVMNPGKVMRKETEDADRA